MQIHALHIHARQEELSRGRCRGGGCPAAMLSRGKRCPSARREPRARRRACRPGSPGGLPSPQLTAAWIEHQQGKAQHGQEPSSLEPSDGSPDSTGNSQSRRPSLAAPWQSGGSAPAAATTKRSSPAGIELWARPLIGRRQPATSWSGAHCTRTGHVIPAAVTPPHDQRAHGMPRDLNEVRSEECRPAGCYRNRASRTDPAEAISYARFLGWPCGCSSGRVRRGGMWVLKRGGCRGAW